MRALVTVGVGSVVDAGVWDGAKVGVVQYSLRDRWYSVDR